MLDSLSPYEFVKYSNNSYFFTNIYEIKYQVYFSEGWAYFENSTFSKYVFSFGFAPLSTPNIQFDTRTADTIICILNDYFQCNENTIILFVCDEKDSRQANRNRLFNRWFEKYNDGLYSKLDLVFEENTFVSAIIAKNNLFYDDFVAEFPSLGGEYK